MKLVSGLTNVKSLYRDCTFHRILQTNNKIVASCLLFGTFDSRNLQINYAPANIIPCKFGKLWSSREIFFTETNQLRFLYKN
jgi:hypothetical protein